MKISGEHLIHAPQNAVWEALNDPITLKACIPGCETIERLSKDSYRISVLATVGPIRSRFNGSLALSNVNSPYGYTLEFEISGGTAGFGKGEASVALSPSADSTQLKYDAEAEVSGKLAQVGSRLIDGVSKKMAAEFFANFRSWFDTPTLDADGHKTDVSSISKLDSGESGSDISRDFRTVSTSGLSMYREVRIWRITAIFAIAVACLAIGYIIGSF